MAMLYEYRSNGNSIKGKQCIMSTIINESMIIYYITHLSPKWESNSCCWCCWVHLQYGKHQLYKYIYKCV